MWVVTQELLGKYNCNLRMLSYLPALGYDYEWDFQGYQQVHFGAKDLSKSRYTWHTVTFGLTCPNKQHPAFLVL